jgi:hypothetical protein
MMKNWAERIAWTVVVLAAMNAVFLHEKCQAQGGCTTACLVAQCDGWYSTLDGSKLCFARDPWVALHDWECKQGLVGCNGSFQPSNDPYSGAACGKCDLLCTTTRGVNQEGDNCSQCGPWVNHTGRNWCVLGSQ